MPWSRPRVLGSWVCLPQQNLFFGAEQHDPERQHAAFWGGPGPFGAKVCPREDPREGRKTGLRASSPGPPSPVRPVLGRPIQKHISVFVCFLIFWRKNLTPELVSFCFFFGWCVCGEGEGGEREGGEGRSGEVTSTVYLPHVPR